MEFKFTCKGLKDNKSIKMQDCTELYSCVHTKTQLNEAAKWLPKLRSSKESTVYLFSLHMDFKARYRAQVDKVTSKACMVVMSGLFDVMTWLFNADIHVKNCNATIEGLVRTVLVRTTSYREDTVHIAGLID